MRYENVTCQDVAKVMLCSSGCQLKVHLVQASGRRLTAADVCGSRLAQHMHAVFTLQGSWDLMLQGEAGPALWSAEEPNLYILVLSLIAPDGSHVESESCQVHTPKLISPDRNCFWVGMSDAVQIQLQLEQSCQRYRVAFLAWEMPFCYLVMGMTVGISVQTGRAPEL